MQDASGTTVDENSDGSDVPSIWRRFIAARNQSLAFFLLLIVGWTVSSWFIHLLRTDIGETLPRDFIVDLNHATQAELNLLPGVGPKLAQEILKYREDRGGFESVEDLMNIRGIKDGRIHSLRKHLRVTRLETVSR